MNWLERFIRWLTGDLSAEGEVPESAAPAPMPAPVPKPTPPTEEPESAPTREIPGGPAPARETDPVNDAEAYGVSVERITPPPGTTYWRVRRVHHLTPQENGGRHHIYLDALDEAGQRLYNSRSKIAWEGGEFTVTIDKPTNEPGANYPMYKWQKCTVAMLGAPSDAVHGLSSSHPDEPNPDGSSSGNTLFHHSFLVEFQRAVAQAETPAPEPDPAQGIIEGKVQGGEGLLLQLLKDGAVLAQGQLGRGGAFRLRSLDRGLYEVRILREAGGALVVASGPVRVESSTPVAVNLTVPGVTPPVPGPIPVPVPAPLPAPTPPPPSPGEDDPLFARYVLFGPADHPHTRVHLLLLADKLAAQAVAFGFRAEDAAQAAHVIIIGGEESVSAQVAADLVAAGATVRRVAGSPSAIRRAL